MGLQDRQHLNQRLSYCSVKKRDECGKSGCVNTFFLLLRVSCRLDGYQPYPTIRGNM